MKENKKMIILIGVTIVLIIIVKLLMGNKTLEKIDINSIVKNKETMIIYVESKDSDKCSKCSEIEKYIDKKELKYSKYIIEDYSKEEYNYLLKKLNINKKDFGYPAILYIKEGKLYSNLINIPSTKLVDNYIKDYSLNKVK